MLGMRTGKDVRKKTEKHMRNSDYKKSDEDWKRPEHED